MANHDQTELRKPDVIYIGNAKSGSTYLRSYFKQHSQIHDERQLWYMQLEDDDNIRRQTYLSYFLDVPLTKVLVDVYETLTMAYVMTNTPPMDYPNLRAPDFWKAELMLDPAMPNDGSIIIPGHEEIIRRIKTILPAPRVILGLRNQFDWFVSLYINYINILPGDRSFMIFARTLEGRAAFLAGFYDRTIEAYARAFGRENLFVFLLEELVEKEEYIFSQLCQFLGVEYLPIDHSQSNRYTTPDSLKEIAAQCNVQYLDPFPQSLAFLNRLAHISTGGSGSSKILRDDVHQMIQAAYAFSNYRTMQMTGLDLAKYVYPM